MDGVGRRVRYVIKACLTSDLAISLYIIAGLAAAGTFSWAIGKAIGITRYQIAASVMVIFASFLTFVLFASIFVSVRFICRAWRDSKYGR